MGSTRSRRAAICALCAAWIPCLALLAQAFETPGTFPAAKFLRPDELAGADWKVAPEATNDGLFNTYTVDSRFGSFQARGRGLLAVRVKEVEALAELERVSKSKVFVDAVKNSAMAPVNLVVSFTDKPVETVQGLGGGVKRMWSKTRFQAAEATHDAKEAVAKSDTDAKPQGAEGTKESKTDQAKEATTAYAKKYLGLSGAERRWYGQLGVDPYTDNEALKKAVKQISRIEATAGFGMRFAGLPSVPGARELGKVMDVVWKTDPVELRQRNRKLLLDAGIAAETARAFEDNAALSPTLQTALIQSLQDLAGVTGRQHLIARAIDVEDTPAARILVTSTALLARYHRQVEPLAEILPGALLPVARTKGRGLVAVAAVETAFWTRELAEGTKDFAAIYAGEPAAARDLRLVGEASERFKTEAKALGWQVSDHWQTAAPEDRLAAAPSNITPPALSRRGRCSETRCGSCRCPPSAASGPPAGNAGSSWTHRDGSLP